MFTCDFSGVQGKTSCRGDRMTSLQAPILGGLNEQNLAAANQLLLS